jgi:hypothetical protein
MWELIEASAVTFAMHLVFAVVALFVGAVAILAVDRLVLRKIDLQAEISRGNLAAAVYASAIWISLALILALGR